MCFKSPALDVLKKCSGGRLLEARAPFASFGLARDKYCRYDSNVVLKHCASESIKFRNCARKKTEVLAVVFGLPGLRWFAVAR